jgi:putative ABC transport system permease protein
MKFLPLLWAGIWRKPGRTVLAVVQILLVFALFGLLQGFSSYSRQAIANIDADLLSVHSRGSYSNLPRADYEQIVQVPGVKLVNFANYFPATYQIPTQKFLVIITDAHNWTTMTHDIVIAPADVERLARTRTGAIVGDALMRKYGWKVGQRLPVQIDVAQQDGSKNWTFDIVGVLHMKDPEAREHSTFIVINYDYFNEARATEKSMIQQYMVRVTDPKRAGAVADAIDRLFANSAYETRTESVREMAQQQMRSIGDLDFVIHAIVGAVLFSLLFSIGALLMQTVRERTPELAVLKTVGFTDGAVVAILVVEASLLCVVSACLGLGLAALLFWIAERINFWPNYVQVPATVLAAGAGLALLLAAASAALPAWRGQRLQVAEALAGR